MEQQRDYTMKVVLGTACVMYYMKTLTVEATRTNRNFMEFQIIQEKGEEEQNEDTKSYLI